MSFSYMFSRVAPTSEPPCPASTIIVLTFGFFLIIAGIGFVVFASGYFVIGAVGRAIEGSSGTFGTDTVTWA